MRGLIVVANYTEPIEVGAILDQQYTRVRACARQGGLWAWCSPPTHLQLGQRVALKLLLRRCCTNQDADRRFPARLAPPSRIQSEHVSPFTDVGTLDSASRTS